jgi:hypothetical protein
MPRIEVGARLGRSECRFADENEKKSNACEGCKSDKFKFRASIEFLQRAFECARSRHCDVGINGLYFLLDDFHKRGRIHDGPDHVGAPTETLNGIGNRGAREEAPGGIVEVANFEVADDADDFEIGIMRGVEERTVEDFQFYPPSDTSDASSVFMMP